MDKISIFDKVLDWVGGSFLQKIIDTAMAYFPPDMSPEKKAEVQLMITNQAVEQQKLIFQQAHEMDVEFNQRIKDLEGTATDLKSVPFLGSIMLFLRGCQRPIWGFVAMYIDYMWFSGSWDIQSGSQQGSVFIIINFLVLGFLFGERALQNVLPYFMQLTQTKKQ